MGRGDDGMRPHGGNGREGRYGNSASGRRSPYEGGRMDRMERGRDRGRERDRDNHSANAPAFSTDMGRALSGPGPASSAIIPGLGSHAAASPMQSMHGGTPYSHSRSAYAPSSPPPPHNPYGPSTHSHVYSQQPYSPQPSSGQRSMQGAGSARAADRYVIFIPKLPSIRFSSFSYQGTTGASTIANGLDALNLGNQNSEFLSVLSQFYHTLRGNYAAQEKWKS